MASAAVTAPVANRGAITACVILAVIMQALDTTIANVALPYIQGSVSASADQINWVLTSYIVAAAIMTPPSGFLAARFGRKRVLSAAIIGFVVPVARFRRRVPPVPGADRRLRSGKVRLRSCGRASDQVRVKAAAEAARGGSSARSGARQCSRTRAGG